MASTEKSITGPPGAETGPVNPATDDAEAAGGVESGFVRSLEEREADMLRALLDIRKGDGSSRSELTEARGNYMALVESSSESISALQDAHRFVPQAYLSNLAVANHLLGVSTAGLKVEATQETTLPCNSSQIFDMPLNQVHIIRPTPHLIIGGGVQAESYQSTQSKGILVAHKGFCRRRDNRPLHVVTDMPAIKREASPTTVKYSIGMIPGVSYVTIKFIRQKSRMPTINIIPAKSGSNKAESYKVTTYTVMKQPN